MVEKGKGCREERLKFSVASLELEGILHLPPAEGSSPGVVVCHPHPLYGGDMSSSVVVAICRALAEASIIAFRFNFRGVGRSQGSFADGIGEREDVEAALALLSSVERAEPARMGLAGYSFGAAVASAVAFEEERVRALALVSPSLPAASWEQLGRYAKPKFLLCGSEDSFVSAERLRRLPDPYQWEVIPGADHFWWGYEGKLATKVSTFFATVLQ